MAEIASAYVSLLPSAKGFSRKLDSQIGSDLDKSGAAGGKRFGGAFSKVARSALGLAVVAGVGKLFKDSIEEAREAQKVGAQTEAVIKSTGGAAKVSAKQFGALATAISLKTGIDDEQIQAGENMLATFTNVRNAAGKNNDIFSQATKIAVDMGVATKTGPVQANLLLGKALNDPAKGLSRLTKIGVTFTDQQKKQVAAMVKSGDTAGAQKIILKELAKEFGGSAAAQATAGDKMAVAIGNLKEQIGTAMLPVIDRLATAITTKVVPALSIAVDYLKANPGIVYAFGAAVAALAAAFVVAFIAANAIPIAVAAVVAGIVYAYTRFETFRKIVDFAMAAIKFYVLTNIKIVSAVIRGVWGAISAAIGFFRSFYTNVRDFIFKVVAKVREIKDKIKNAFAGAKDWLVNVGKQIIDGLINGIKSKFNDVKNTLGDLTGKLTSWKGPASLDRVILQPSGRMVVDGFISGLESRYSNVQSSLGGLTSDLSSSVTVPTGAQFKHSTNSPAPAGSADSATSAQIANRKLAQMLAQGVRIVGPAGNQRLYFEGV